MLSGCRTTYTPATPAARGTPHARRSRPPWREHPRERAELAFLALQRAWRPGREHDRLARRTVLEPARVGGALPVPEGTGGGAARRPAGRRGPHHRRVREPFAAAQPGGRRSPSGRTG